MLQQAGSKTALKNWQWAHRCTVSERHKQNEPHAILPKFCLCIILLKASRFISCLWSRVYPLTKRKQGILLKSSTNTTHKQQMSITLVQLASKSLPCPTLHIFWANCQCGMNRSKIASSWCFAVAVTSHVLTFWKHRSGSVGVWVNLGGKKRFDVAVFYSTMWLLEAYGAIY